jgi:iron complex transport system ATP-binding protein
MAERALDARGVCANAGRARVLHDVTFHADYGSVLAILGPNGAGKSTLLRALAGLLAYEGALALDGAELSGRSRREIGRRIAFVPQRTQLTSRLPVWTVVSHGRYAHRGGLAQLSTHDERCIESAMRRADVAHLSTREFPQLSAGEQRRVLLARALATEARVLLLDEPTAALDIPHALSLFETLRGLAESGHCVVIVLHQLDDALRFTDRALLLQTGRQLAFDRSAEVITAEHVRSAYGVELIAQGGLAFRLAGPGA